MRSRSSRALDALEIGYRTGMFKPLVERCPGLTNLVIEEHSDFPPDDFRELEKLKLLRRLEIHGDLGIGVDVFAALGELTQVRHLDLALG